MDVDPKHFEQTANTELTLQGCLSLTPTTEDTAGTSVVTGSHLLTSKTYKDGSGLCRGLHLNNEGLESLTGHGCKLLHMSTDQGDLVVWKCQTTHCGRMWRIPVPGNPQRFAAYITYSRADQLDPQRTAAAKRHAMGLDDRNQPVHLPHTTGATSGEGYFDRDGRGLQRSPSVALTDEALRVAGILPYPQWCDPSTHGWRLGGDDAGSAHSRHSRIEAAVAKSGVAEGETVAAAFRAQPQQNAAVAAGAAALARARLCDAIDPPRGFMQGVQECVIDLTDEGTAAPTARCAERRGPPCAAATGDGASGGCCIKKPRVDDHVIVID